MTDAELTAVLRWQGSALQEGAFFAAADRIEALTADFALQVQRTDEQREAYEQALSVMEADNVRLLGLLRNLADEYANPFNESEGPAYNAALAALNTGKADK